MIYKGRKRGTWRIQIEDGKDAVGGRRRLSKTFKGTYKAAQDEEARLLTERALGTYVQPSKETVEHFLERWLTVMEAQLTPSAHHAYARIVRLRWVPELGTMRIQALRGPDIGLAEAKWLKSGRLGLDRGSGKALSAKTVLNFHRVLHEAMQAAVRERIIAINPCTALDAPKPERTEQRALSVDEAATLLQAITLDRHSAALHTLLGTGLRAGELLGLRWRDVDLEGGVVRVTQQWDKVAQRYRDVKSHRSRRPISIDSDLVRVLHAHSAQQKERKLKALGMWQESGLVFTDDLGEGLKHDQLSYALERCLKAAGLDHLGPHALRHTHASILIAAGTHMRVIQERLGHASFAITADTYSHVAPSLGVRAAEDFRRVLKGNSNG